MALEKKPDKKSYDASLGDGDETNAIVKVGGGDGKKFVPNINVSKHDDEYWLNINHENIVIPDGQVESFEDGKVSTKVDDITSKFYVLPDGNDNVLEYEVIHDTHQEDIEEIVLKLKYSNGLSFHFQDELTPEEIAEGNERIPRVIGSYAVYCDKKHNKYKTGKFCHLYRWEAIDANGNREWCDKLRIEKKDLIIGLPTKWLETAVYPVTFMGAGDTFGYTSVGGSGSNLPTAYQVASGPFEPDSDGIASSVTWHKRDATSLNITLGIYDNNGLDEPENLLGDGSGVNSSAMEWVTDTLDSSVSVTSGSYYWLGMQSNGTFNASYDTLTGSHLYYMAISYTSGLLSDPFEESPARLNDRVYSCYVTYTTGGGPATKIRNPLAGPLGGPLTGVL